MLDGSKYMYTTANVVHDFHVIITSKSFTKENTFMLRLETVVSQNLHFSSLK